MPNPSTLAAGLHDELEAARATFADLRRPKGTREQAYRDIRRLEKELDATTFAPTPPAGGFQPVARRTASLTRGQRAIIINDLRFTMSQPNTDPEINAERVALMDYLKSL
jgi:uncharacterized sporulation protein YeaH/YhbH (DUF444 family)